MSYLNNIVSHWDMSEINPQDIGWKKNGNNGKSFNISSSNIVNGIAGLFALSFNGVDEYIDIGNDSSLNFTSDFSIAGWVTGNGTSKMIISKDFNTSYEVYFAAGNVLRFNTNGSSLDSIRTITAIAQKWYFFCVTFESGSPNIKKIYLDGILDNTGTTGTDIIGNNSNALIGRRQGGSLYFGSNIDSLFLFDAVLTNIQQADLYQRTMGGRI